MPTFPYISWCLISRKMNISFSVPSPIPTVRFLMQNFNEVDRLHFYSNFPTYEGILIIFTISDRISALRTNTIRLSISAPDYKVTT